MLSFVRSTLQTATRVSGNGVVLVEKRFHHSLIVREFGDPSDVLLYENIPDKDTLGSDEIHVKILAAPINPSDINTIEGSYPLKPPPNHQWSLPAVPGHEGVGRILAKGSNVQGFQVGDLAVPVVSHQGTWREEGVFAADCWHRVPKDLPIELAATMAINPPTALCMIHDFTSLQAGDVIAQNGATGAVAQCVIQLAKARELHTVNIIRNRPNVQKTIERLRDLGADLVDTEDNINASFSGPESNLANISAAVCLSLESSGLPLASLGLNCIGGESASILTKLMKKHSTVVTYGGMSKEPLQIPTSALVFKDLKFKGFWWSGHASDRMGISKKRACLDQIADLIQQKHLSIKIESFKLSDYKAAFKRHVESYREGKVLFIP